MIAAILAAPALAQADGGFYFEESGAAASYKGGLGAYGTGAFRFTFSGNLRDGARTYSAGFGAAFGEGTGVDHSGGYGFASLDVRRTWQLNDLHPFVPRRAGIRVSIGGGPRWFVGTDALTGYKGPGASADMRLEGDAWVIGYYLLAGVDVLAMRMPADGVVGVVPFLGIGAKIGWL